MSVGKEKETNDIHSKLHNCFLTIKDKTFLPKCQNKSLFVLNAPLWPGETEEWVANFIVGESEYGSLGSKFPENFGSVIHCLLMLLPLVTESCWLLADSFIDFYWADILWASAMC